MFERLLRLLKLKDRSKDDPLVEGPVISDPPSERPDPSTLSPDNVVPLFPRVERDPDDLPPAA